MREHISARDARARFAEVTDRVKYTGEPVIVDKQGRPFVALIRSEDLELVESLLATELRDVLGWGSEALEAIRSRTWSDLAS